MVDLIILPFHSAFFRFTILATTQKSKESKLEIKFKPIQFNSLNLTYSYTAVEGSLSFSPTVYKFQPAFQSM